MTDPEIVEWGIERAGELLDLVDVAYPGDRVTLDELEAACWGPVELDGQPRVVLGRADGSAALALRLEGRCAAIGAVAASPAPSPDESVAGLIAELVAVASATAEAWGAVGLFVGGSVPDHLWPGLTELEQPLIGALGAAGFTPIEGARIDSVPTTFRSAVPADITLVDVFDADLVDATRAWVMATKPAIEPWVRRSIAQATCAVAVERATGRVVGVGAHSVGRDGWIGPVVVADGFRRGGVGSALVAHAARDLMVAGFGEAPLAWCALESGAGAGGVDGPGGVTGVWPAGFLDHIGARPWRTFRRWQLALG